MKLNLGSGVTRHAGFINVDRSAECHPDIIWNLEQSPWPFETNSVDHILMNHCLEHLGASTDNFLAIIKELYRICRNGAKIEIVVPHPLHDNFFIDPTHVRPIMPDTFDLFNKENNLEWRRRGLSISPLALQCEVDFKLVRSEQKFDPRFVSYLQNQKEEKLSIEILINRFGRNAIMEFYILLEVQKSDLPSSVTYHDSKNIEDNTDSNSIISAIKNSDYHKALELAQKRIQECPDDPLGWRSLGFIFSYLGNLEDALECYEKVVALDQTDIETLCNINTILNSLNRSLEAINFLIPIINNGVESPDLFNAIGISYKKLSQLETAYNSFSKAILLRDDFSEAYYHRGNILFLIDQFKKADEDYIKAISYSKVSIYAEAFTGRANIAYKLMNFESSLINYAIALQANPQLIEALNNRAVLYTHIESFEKAYLDLNEAIKINPRYAEARFNMGNLFFSLGDFEKAKDLFMQAYKLGYSYDEVQYNISFIDLLRGNLIDGFAKYEFRKTKTNPLGVRSYSKPLWNGVDDISGKRLYVYYEQGLGDTIQFLRFLKFLENSKAEIVFEPQQKLYLLAKTLSSNCLLVDRELSENEFDYHISLLSLPYILKTKISTIPAYPAYLDADPIRIAKWNALIGDQGFKVAVAWECSQHLESIGRSFPIEVLRKLNNIEGIRLISIQKEIVDLKRLDSLQIENFFDAKTDKDGAFLDTAAIIKNCDLVISCDTSVAHLAGALGVQTWIALKYIPHWIWLMNESMSPWYPSVKLFRQKKHGDWDDVFEEIARQLQDLIRS